MALVVFGKQQATTIEVRVDGFQFAQQQVFLEKFFLQPNWHCRAE